LALWATFFFAAFFLTILVLAASPTLIAAIAPAHSGTIFALVVLHSAGTWLAGIGLGLGFALTHH
jgi:hypothetical protein